jgi:hypothetical protein
MNAITIEHVPVSELPQSWQAKLGTISGRDSAHVTVRIEQEDAAFPATATATATTTSNADDPAFGMWRDREEMADVQAYLSTLREPRYRHDGSRK